MLSLSTLNWRNCVRRSWCNKFRHNKKFGVGFRKKLGLPIGTATLMCPQSSENRNKRRKCSNRSSELVAKQTILLQSTHQQKTKEEGELQTMLKIPVLCCPAQLPRRIRILTCICILLTLRMYQSKSGIEGCRVQYTYQISFSFSLFGKNTPNSFGIGEGPE
jgi:hypothetical protein